MTTKPKVFLSYASEDRAKVYEVYDYLSTYDIDIWFDVVSLQPGQNWEYEIEKAIEACDFFIGCFSKNSVTKTGFIQKEVKKGVDLLKMQPEGKIFLIPVRLDPCELPRDIAKQHWLDWFVEEQQDKIIKTIQIEFPALKLPINDKNNETIIRLTRDYSNNVIEPLFDYSEHKDWVISIEFKQSISEDGSYCDFVTAGRDGKIIFWEGGGYYYRSNIIEHEYTRFNHAIFNPINDDIVCASDDGGDITLIDLKTKSIVEKFNAHKYLVTSVAFTNDGQKILSSGDDNFIRLWDVKTQSLILEISGHSAGMIGHGWGSKGSPTRFRRNGIDHINFSPDNSKIISASYDGTARVWDIHSGEELLRLVHREWVMSACFSPDGEKILTAGHDKVARLWTSKGEELLTFEGHSNWIRRANFSFDGRFITTASEDRTARIFDVNTGKELKQFTHNNLVTDAKLSPDLYFLVTTVAERYGNNVKLWNSSDLRTVN